MKPTVPQILALIGASLEVRDASLALTSVPRSSFELVANHESVHGEDQNEAAVRFVAQTMLEAYDKLDAYRLNNPLV